MYHPKKQTINQPVFLTTNREETSTAEYVRHQAAKGAMGYLTSLFPSAVVHHLQLYRDGRASHHPLPMTYKHNSSTTSSSLVDGDLLEPNNEYYSSCQNSSDMDPNEWADPPSTSSSIPPFVVPATVYFPVKKLSLSTSSLTIDFHHQNHYFLADNNNNNATAASATSTATGWSACCSGGESITDIDFRSRQPPLDSEVITQMDIVRIIRSVTRDMEHNNKAAATTAAIAMNDEDPINGNGGAGPDILSSRITQADDFSHFCGVRHQPCCGSVVSKPPLMLTNSEEAEEEEEDSIPSWSFVLLGESLEEDKDDSTTDCSEGLVPPWSFVMVGSSLLLESQEHAY